MENKYYYCTKCRRVGGYVLDPLNGIAYFPQKELDNHYEYLMAGFTNKKEAARCLKNRLREKKS